MGDADAHLDKPQWQEQTLGQERAERLYAWILAHVAALDEYDKLTVNFALAGPKISAKLEIIEPV